jgi:hypothetical protein
VSVRKITIKAFIAILYLVTWVGGWIRHSHDLEANAWDWYRMEEQRNAKNIAACIMAGLEPFTTPLNKDGPATQVYWCLPILPGVLLADSDSVIGPMSGYGGLRIVLYYGFGSTDLWLYGWIA